MLPFRKIVFPVDYSEPCKAIIPHVRETMRRFSATLTMVHAYGLPILPNELAFTEFSLPEEVRKAEESRLRQFATESFPGEHVETLLREGDPGEVIGDVVQHQGADLVMLGTRGNGPLRRFLLGSVTTKVLHDISAAVWTGVCSELQEHKPDIPYRSILCALDDSPEAEAVLRGAAAMAKAYGATWSIAHVVETPVGAIELDFAAIKKDLMDSADLRIRELKKSVGIDTPHTILQTSIADGIRDEALRISADLVVAGRGHSQGTVTRLFSYLYPIIRETPCPVLSI